MTELLVDALACFRLTHLTSADALLEEPRDWITEWASRTHHRKVRYFATCPWCQSFHWGIFVFWARRRHPEQWAPVATVLAFSAVTGILATTTEH